eukprot:SAG31_NODE_11761_length_1000_cov_1.395117_1_plen_197_part_01
MPRLAQQRAWTAPQGGRHRSWGVLNASCAPRGGTRTGPALRCARLARAEGLPSPRAARRARRLRRPRPMATIPGRRHRRPRPMATILGRRHRLMMETIPGRRHRLMMATIRHHQRHLACGVLARLLAACHVLVTSRTCTMRRVRMVTGNAARAVVAPATAVLGAASMAVALTARVDCVSAIHRRTPYAKMETGPAQM